MLLILKVFAIEQGWNCHTMYIDEPPFWVAVGDSGMKGKGYENIKEVKRGKLKNARVIPKGSIVIKDPERPLIQNPDNGAEYMPVIVASIQNTKSMQKRKKIIADNFNAQEGFNKRIYPMAAAKNPIVMIGDDGYIFAGRPKSWRDKNGNQHIARVNPSIIAPGTLKLKTKKASVSNDFVFIVKQDAPFFDVPGVDKFDQNHLLALDVSNGQYKVNKCVDPMDSENFVLNYVFNVKKVNTDGTIEQVSNLSIDTTSDCGFEFLTGIMPIDEKLHSQLLNLSIASQSISNQAIPIEEMLFMQEMDMVQIPQGAMKKIGKQCYSKGPFGSYHYIGAGVSRCPAAGVGGRAGKRQRQKAIREQQSDSLLRPAVACAFSGGSNSVLKRFKDRCSECIVQWGDAFWPKGARHKGHRRGTCIDMRPQKQDNSIGVSNASDTTRYSADKTQILIEELLRAGAHKVMFNGGSMLKKISPDLKTSSKIFQDKKVGHLYNRLHSNHIHVCFPGKPQVQKQLVIQKSIVNLQARIKKLNKRRVTKKNKLKIKNLKKRIEKQESRLKALKLGFARMKKAC
ncbi:MAG: hypothetical protein ISR65_11315, partial [Bacteriovoracaceae bacterium]|nr:hypothetical protein [Bacteriovoracaceae bacterium]